MMKTMMMSLCFLLSLMSTGVALAGGGGSSSVGTGSPASAIVTFQDDNAYLEIRGDSAKDLYEYLNVSEAGPYCLGLCVPGQACDSTCSTLKIGDQLACSKIHYIKSDRDEFQCNARVDHNGQVFQQ